MKITASTVIVHGITQEGASLSVRVDGRYVIDGKYLSIDDLMVELEKYQTTRLYVQWFDQMRPGNQKHYELWHRTDASWKMMDVPSGYTVDGRHWAGYWTDDEGNEFSSDTLIDGHYGIQTSATNEATFGHGLALRIDALVWAGEAK